MIKWKDNRKVFLTAIAFGTMLNPLNSSMISLALHQIQHEFGLSFTTVSWLISTFYLASAVTQPVSGRIGDHVMSRRTLFLFGLVLVAVSAICAPFAPTFAVLIVIRLLQAIGSSAIYPSGVGLIRDHVKERQASALAVLSIFASAMTALGPTLGGFLMTIGSWPAIFLVNLPFILISFFLGLSLFPKEKKKKLRIGDTVRKLDLPGMFLFTVCIVLLLSFLLSLSDGIQYVQGILCLVSVGVFIWWEYQVDEPFIQIRMFRQEKRLSLVYVQFIILNIFFYCLFFGLPSYFQDELGWRVEMTGLFMLCMSGVSIMVSPLTGKWVDRGDERHPVLASAVLMLAGASAMTFFFIPAPFWGKGLVLALLGLSYGIGNVALQAAMLKASPQQMIGTTSGLFQTCRYLGSILSSAVLGMLFGEEIAGSHFEQLGWTLIMISLVGISVSLYFSSMVRGKQTMKKAAGIK
ncbi:MFS transporter [Bacillus altitudinis]|uniref:MFS transporter n=1 Tax=Bacillus altitudinis TaxID=293387 RepID=UPI002EBFCC74|nr:MFS transporter [Bacillus altitudinis]MEE3610217.1 MFS transporter [Bacillus altitudinis]MEE3645994.1 MFS transporter [Bacillus altitudinis]MEE4390417.1 MFS transporter [Bacillus altitudinis]MEE4393967.1 MFS transporter [Bacillus altitudinis]